MYFVLLSHSFDHVICKITENSRKYNMSFTDPLIIKTFEKRAPGPLGPKRAAEIEPRSQMAGGKR